MQVLNKCATFFILYLLENQQFD